MPENTTVGGSESSGQGRGSGSDGRGGGGGSQSSGGGGGSQSSGGYQNSAYGGSDGRGGGGRGGSDGRGGGGRGDGRGGSDGRGGGSDGRGGGGRGDGRGGGGRSNAAYENESENYGGAEQRNRQAGERSGRLPESGSTSEAYREALQRGRRGEYEELDAEDYELDFDGDGQPDQGPLMAPGMSQSQGQNQRNPAQYPMTIAPYYNPYGNRPMQYPVNYPMGNQQRSSGGYQQDYMSHQQQYGYAPMTPERVLKLQEKFGKILKMNMTGMSSLFDLINRRGQLAHQMMQNFHQLSDTEKAQVDDQMTHLDAALREAMCL